MESTLSHRSPGASASVALSGASPRRRTVQRLIVTAFGAAVAMAPLACSADQQAASDTDPTSLPAQPGLAGSGSLAAPGGHNNAVTYDPALAPEDAELKATLTPSDGATTVDFSVTGLVPNRGYAVHAHTKPCGSTGKDAGPHFQKIIDPAATAEKPSADPAYANPKNEIWLDLRTDAQGDGSSEVSAPFVFADRAPASIVVHSAEHTATEPGKAGTAGDRVACLTLEGSEADGAGHG